MSEFPTIPVFLALLSLLAATGIWYVLIRTPLVVAIIGSFDQDVYTRQDVENWLLARRRWITLKLYTCGHCQAFWTAVVAAIFFNSVMVLVQDYSSNLFMLTPVFALISTPITSWMQRGH